MSTSHRDSGTKRHSSSKYGRELSPKRWRRDGRHDAEKKGSNADGEARHGRDYYKKHQHMAEDHLPLQSHSSKVEDVLVSKGSDKKTDEPKDSDKKVDGSKESIKKENGSPVDKKHSSEIPRSRFQYQHDARGNMRRLDHSSYQRATTDRGWGKDSRDRHGDREAGRFRSHLTHYRDDKVTDRGKGERAWRHDGFFELEGIPPQPASRKRSAFSEQKIAVEVDKKEQPKNIDTDERGSRIPQPFDRNRGGRRPFNGDRGITNWGEGQDFGPSSRDRFAGSSGNHMARDRTNTRQGFHEADLSDKWKHDMFSEANRSPTPKNEDDQIAKVEALLAS